MNQGKVAAEASGPGLWVTDFDQFCRVSGSAVILTPLPLCFLVIPGLCTTLKFRVLRAQGSRYLPNIRDLSTHL